MLARLLAAAVLILSASAASAQSVRCSAFLHEADGSWRSFETGDIIGPRGPVHVETGERFSRDAPSPRNAVADLLDHICTN